MWFTEYGAGKVGRMTTAGTKVKEFVIPAGGSNPQSIAVGPDGNLWFTEFGADQIGRVTPKGNITEFAVPTPGAGPDVIVAGSDGNLWFTEYYAARIGRITTAGAVAEFAVSSPSSQPEGIAAAPDGALWFTESSRSHFGNYAGLVGQITTDGSITEFPVPSDESVPDGITVGPDGNLWLTEYFGPRVARLLPRAATVLVLPSGLTPSGLKVAQGTAVEWTFLAPGTHSVVDTSGMSLFNSGSRPIAASYSFSFLWAGTYPYEDNGDLATGSVKVPVTAKPKSGGTSTGFTLTWAAGPPPAGFVFDVQVKRPGHSSFVDWKHGTSALSAKFTPDAGKGTYSFRARLRKASSGAVSGYSAALKIKVT